MSDSDDQVAKNQQKVNNDQSAGPSKMFNMCAQRLLYETQSTDSNQSTQATQEIGDINNDPGKSNTRQIIPVRVDNKAAERSRLYRERHREEINRRRRDIRKRKNTSQQIQTLSDIEKINEVEQITDATSNNQLSSNSHTQRQQRYYERHKEELNKRKRDSRLQHRIPQSIPASAAERNRIYRERNRQIINERRRDSRLRQQNLQRVHEGVHNQPDKSSNLLGQSNTNLVNTHIKVERDEDSCVDIGPTSISESTYSGVHNQPDKSSNLLGQSNTNLVNTRIKVEYDEVSCIDIGPTSISESTYSGVHNQPDKSSNLLGQSNTSLVNTRIKVEYDEDSCIDIGPTSISESTYSGVHDQPDKSSNLLGQLNTNLVNTCIKVEHDEDSCVDIGPTSISESTYSIHSAIHDRASPSAKTSLANDTLVMRNAMIDLIFKYPKMYIGVPKRHIWILDDIIEKSRTDVTKIDIIIALFKIKQNDGITRITHAFELSKTKTIKSFHDGLAVLKKTFQNTIFMLTKDQTKEHLPVVSEVEYPNLQYILNVFEIKIQKPNVRSVQIDTWSPYKRCYTRKYLLLSTPNGFISYISNGFGGRTSDKTLVEHSDFLKIIPESCVILAQRGIKNIDHVLKPKGVKIFEISNFSNKIPQWVRDKVISSLNVQRERVIRRLRGFRFLKPDAVVTNDYIGCLDQILIIACGLINLDYGITKVN